MRRTLIKFLVLSPLGILFFLPYFNCSFQPKSEEHPESPWKNVYNPDAKYVGMQTCRGCHSEVYNTFMETGMGKSFDHATKQKSAADFSPEHALVYDSVLDYYYHPYWNGDTLYIQEFRLAGKDTIHSHTQKIDYIIGSGQHTNSHLFNVNGYVYQAPITFYTQKKRWDLAPGFEKGANSRFSRMIQLECMSCHNGYPEFVEGSENKYKTIKTGIDCERCHGPGSLHVADKMAGKVVDTSKGPDYTIVNPRRLSTELQNNVCQRCHLQGITVLNDGKSFFDFRPGMKLSEVMNVYMPEYEGAGDKMIMASHVERMKKSRCYVESGKMSCINCHNPHVSVKATPRVQYLNACAGCHSGAGVTSKCKEQEAIRMAENNDCIRCHMPRNGSIDIPHVAVTDHYIRRKPANDTLKKNITAFLGMQCFNNNNTGEISHARGFIEFYERYTPSPGLLDSAEAHLAKEVKTEQGEKQNRDLIRIQFLRNKYNEVVQLATGLKPETVNDAWTCYRVGEAMHKTGASKDALAWYQRAIALWPFSLDFQFKLGTCQIACGDISAAKKVFTFILSENPNHIGANRSQGFIAMQENSDGEAHNYMLRCLELDPDDELNLVNLAVLMHKQNRDADAERYLKHLLTKHPGNEQAKAMMQYLQKRN